MKHTSIEKDFELIGRMMEEDFVYLDPAIGFDGACLIAGINVIATNNYVSRTFGITGQELFRAYRDSYRRHLYNKYRPGVVIE